MYVQLFVSYLVSWKSRITTQRFASHSDTAFPTDSTWYKQLFSHMCICHLSPLVSKLISITLGYVPFPSLFRLISITLGYVPFPSLFRLISISLGYVLFPSLFRLISITLGYVPFSSLFRLISISLSYVPFPSLFGLISITLYYILFPSLQIDKYITGLCPLSLSLFQMD
jgi:hypothetical protein